MKYLVSFLKSTFIVLVITFLNVSFNSCSTSKSDCPAFLSNYEKLYEVNPRKATQQWFKDAKYGLFIHYGLYSLTGKHPFLQFNEKIPVKEYEKLKDKFTAEKFDADKITDLAIDAGMKYITLVTKHCEGFCLWNTKETSFNLKNSSGLCPGV